MQRIVSRSLPGGSTADRVAAEHVVWAAAAGQSPREILDAVGQPWTAEREPDWHDAMTAVAIAWLKLPKG